MKILTDMNLSPEWEIGFNKYTINAIHWSNVGKPDADDALLMQWARENEHIVLLIWILVQPLPCRVLTSQAYNPCMLILVYSYSLLLLPIASLFVCKTNH